MDQVETLHTIRRAYAIAVRDLRACTADVAARGARAEGAAAMYGMLGALPDRGMVKEALLDFMDGLDTHA